MAFLHDASFLPSDDVSRNQPYLAEDMLYLHKTLVRILTRISGPPVITSEGRLFMKPVKGLNARRDGLKAKYQKIWDDTIIYYDASSYGASANIKDYYIWFGEFFTKPQPELVLEKVLWHEFLHIVLDLPKSMHHGHINRIIKQGLKLNGDPNPLGTVGLEC